MAEPKAISTTSIYLAETTI